MPAIHVAAIVLGSVLPAQDGEIEVQAGRESDLLESVRKLSEGGPTIHFGDEGRIKFGLREQFKLESSELENRNDFMIRRSRFKAEGGLLPGTSFKVELKIDDVGREGHDPKAQAEDVSFFIPVLDDRAAVRIGLYDAPLSRDSLTSDSKLLLMDRSALHDAYSGVGLSDNTIGAQISGLVGERLELRVGLFDNVELDAQTRQLMPMGRVVLHLLDAEKGEYEASRPGSDARVLSVGGSAGFLGGIETGGQELDLTGTEVDLFAALPGGFTFQAEYGEVARDVVGAPDSSASGWYAQGGYHLPGRIGAGTGELAYRYQDHDPGDLEPAAGRERAHTFGFNYYLLGHSLKVQADYTRTSREAGDDGGVFQIQLQLDF